MGKSGANFGKMNLNATVCRWHASAARTGYTDKMYRCIDCGWEIGYQQKLVRLSVMYRHITYVIFVTRHQNVKSGWNTHDGLQIADGSCGM